MKTDSDMLDTTLETFSIKVGGRWTTVRLEPELMEALRDVATRMGLSVNDLCTEIAVDKTEGSFTSALRVFLVQYYRRLGALDPMWNDGGWAARQSPARKRQVDSMRRRPMMVGTRGTADALIGLYKWWSDRRPRNGLVPAHAAIDPAVFRGLGLDGLVHVIDSSAADPLNYQVRLWARRVIAAGDHDCTGERLGEIPAHAYRMAVAEDYFSAVTTGTLQLHEVDASVGDRRRVYQRLIAPFSGIGGKLDSLLVAVSYQPHGLVGQLREDLGA